MEKSSNGKTALSVLVALVAILGGGTITYLLGVTKSNSDSIHIHEMKANHAVAEEKIRGMEKDIDQIKINTYRNTELLNKIDKKLPN